MNFLRRIIIILSFLTIISISIIVNSFDAYCNSDNKVGKLVFIEYKSTKLPDVGIYQKTVEVKTKYPTEIRKYIIIKVSDYVGYRAIPYVNIKKLIFFENEI